AAMASGIGANDVLEISANASLSNPLSGNNVSRSVVVKPNVTLSNSSGSVFSITGLSSLKIENQGRIVGSDNAISLDVSTGTYVFGGTGIYESTGSGKSALRFTASLSTELYLHGGHWVANSGTAVTATNSSSRLNILPAASVD